MVVVLVRWCCQFIVVILVLFATDSFRNKYLAMSKFEHFSGPSWKERRIARDGKIYTRFCETKKVPFLFSRLKLSNFHFFVVLSKGLEFVQFYELKNFDSFFMWLEAPRLREDVLAEQGKTKLVEFENATTFKGFKLKEFFYICIFCFFVYVDQMYCPSRY